MPPTAGDENDFTGTLDELKQSKILDWSIEH
jgi:hypothetical protein